ncbi:MAG: DUF4082 domain-containing protein [Patescibacteria group bacterium]
MSTPSGQSAFTDPGGIEVGFKFRTDVSGYITGVRFYKQGSMGGTHTGNMWTTGGSNLATVTFSGESASGWQEMSFATPVAVTANTTYVASVTMADTNYIATSNYFTSDIVNFPLRAPSSASAGGNGVFNTTPGSFPASDFNATNYWVDVAYVGNLGSAAPTVSTTDPADEAIDVNPGKTIKATFDQALDQATVSTSTFSVKDSSNNAVTGTVSYSNTTRIASFAASDEFSVGETYTATFEGGSGTVVKNMEGIALAADHSWSFTITDTNACPCSLKDRANPAGSATFDDAGGLEIGVKMKAVANGFISAVRFYKPIISTESTHTVNIWSSTGTSLGTATSSNETDYGWQEATFSSPVSVTEGQLFIVSYGTTTAVYQVTVGGLASNMSSGYLTAYADNSGENAATGSGNRNGVFNTTAGQYPSGGSTNGSYYWVDAVFSTSSIVPDPLEVKLTQPAADTYGVERTKLVKATFDQALNAATVTDATVRLFDSSNNQVDGTAGYESISHSVTFTPDNPLTYNQRYTAKLSASIADTDGETLGSEYAWSFTVGRQAATDINQGPGGPILAITSTTNKYSPYYAEILRAEGLNYFETKDLSTVTAATLDGYDAVVLAEMSLTQAQADMFSDWVTADGGNLIAMRPDKKLAGLLGLTDASSTRSNQYLLVDTVSAPGTGIVGETIQFKGAADNYILNGATSVATFYSDASTGTSNPAVTSRTVGSNGGTAAAFSYDLAKSVIAQHQGNQAWAGNDRDGVVPIRANDLFFGAKTGDVQPDWVNLDKIHIPQADEQQRLLANILTEATKDRKPIPRFWYLPYGQKAAMVMAGDDHNLGNAGGTERIFSNWLNESPTYCVFEKWECIRASGYNYTTSSLTAARALQYHNLGLEVADHVSNSAACNNYSSYANLGALYTSDLTTWRAKYTGLPNQRSTRFHCYVWSDWDSQARVDADNGIRYDMGYVAYPNSWIGTRAPMMTGSGMNMRFTDADGDMLDVYQGVTNLDNTTANSTSINALLDNATGSSGYYGIFGTHYDMSDSYHTTLFTAAQSHDVPIISSDQAITWLDGRNNSTFGNISGSDGLFTFSIEAGMGAQGLKAMMPIQDAGGTLSDITLGGAAVSYQAQTVKGVQYAVFDGNPGSYTVTYSDYDPNAGSGSSESGASSNPAGSASKKKTASNTGVFDGNQESPEDALPGAPTEDEGEDSSNNPTEENKKHSIETSSETGVSWIMWLLGMIFAAVATSLIVLGLRRRRHDPAA